ncbi:hypothetical protein [Psychromonas sp. Urea-02u-13]|uniref:hypothetical protein n=1 Tax=Psychromonas sp. Urea-02u-13 TaxID=2058326 RepID=UPI000C33CDE6|nr:hypothetical protein [Psychromonas sp. Urea-02u-13]PKG39797.1 hypothetical protein CXF74_06475 [Psychromonas sp. Urea-02u-13]
MYKNLTAIILAIVSYTTVAAEANVIKIDPVFEEITGAASRNLSPGQRLTQWVFLEAPAGKRHLVSVKYDTNAPDYSTMDCQVYIYTESNELLKKLNCRTDGEFYFETPITMNLEKYKVKISAYNSDFTSGRERKWFTGKFDFTFGNSNHVDNDYLPMWWKSSYDLIGADSILDYDGDGFSIAEEYFGGSNPISVDSFPAHKPLLETSEKFSVGTSLSVYPLKPMTEWVKIKPDNNKRIQFIDMEVEVSDNAKRQSIRAFVYNENNDRIGTGYFYYSGNDLASQRRLILDEPIQVEELNIKIIGSHYGFSNQRVQYNVKFNTVFVK